MEALPLERCRWGARPAGGPGGARGGAGCGGGGKEGELESAARGAPVWGSSGRLLPRGREQCALGIAKKVKDKENIRKRKEETRKKEKTKNLLALSLSAKVDSPASELF